MRRQAHDPSRPHRIPVAPGGGAVSPGRSRGPALLLALALASPGPALAQALESVVLEGAHPSVHVPAGEARVVAGNGSSVRVEVRLEGRDADRLRLETLRLNGSDALVIRYPEGEDVVYPGVRGSTELRMDGEGLFSTQGRRGRGDRVRVRSRGDGVEAWAVVTVHVPAGMGGDVHVGLGTLTSRGVEGELGLRLASGSVEAGGHRGGLDVNVGSGQVEAADVQGGTISLTTGSGSVTARDLQGDQVRLQTGSGSVEVEAITAGSVRIGTGSGGIGMEGVDSPEVHVRTGSGRVAGSLMQPPRELEVQTVSGAVRLDIPRDSGADLDIRTGSGGIEVELPVQIRSSGRSRLQGTVGDGSGSIRITTGSGGVRIGTR